MLEVVKTGTCFCRVKRYCLEVRIALVTHSFGPTEYGGIARIVRDIAQSASQSTNVDVDIFSFESSRHSPNSFSFSRPKSIFSERFSKGIDLLSSSVYLVGSFNADFEVFRYRQRWKLRSRFETYDCVLVVTGFLQFANVVPELDIPVFVQCATRLEWERKSQYERMTWAKRAMLKLQIPLFRIQENAVLRGKKIFLTENSQMKQWVETRSKRKSYLWYPGVNSGIKDLFSNKLNSNQGHFISVGRLNESRKGWSRLMSAYARAYDKNPDIPKLVIVGQGEFSAIDLNTLCNLQKYPIEVHKNLTDSKKDDLLSTASFFLQASFEEGLGLAALEGMQFGLPIISSDTYGAREYVHQESNGFLVLQDDNFCENFTQAILETQNWDYQLLSQNSLNLYLENFSQKDNAKKLFEILYSQVRNLHSRGS